LANPSAIFDAFRAIFFRANIDDLEYEGNNDDSAKKLLFHSLKVDRMEPLETESTRLP